MKGITVKADVLDGEKVRVIKIKNPKNYTYIYVYDDTITVCEPKRDVVVHRMLIRK